MFVHAWGRSASSTPDSWSRLSWLLRQLVGSSKVDLRQQIRKARSEGSRLISTDDLVVNNACVTSALLQARNTIHVHGKCSVPGLMTAHTVNVNTLPLPTQFDSHDSALQRIRHSTPSSDIHTQLGGVQCNIMRIQGNCEVNQVRCRKLHCIGSLQVNQDLDCDEVYVQGSLRMSAKHGDIIARQSVHLVLERGKNRVTRILCPSGSVTIEASVLPERGSFFSRATLSKGVLLEAELVSGNTVKLDECSIVHVQAKQAVIGPNTVIDTLEAASRSVDQDAIVSNTITRHTK